MGFAFFHLNLAFSSIEEERRGEVIANCYHPLLDLCEKHGPLGIEVSGYTLEEITTRDPDWVARARALIAAGKVELIGSGFSQMIGPLVPARVTRENLRLGNKIYQRLLGVTPRLALVNEQAYAGGLVPLYLEAGYDALLMDWENAAANHPAWPQATQYLPHYALGPGGERIALIWSNTTLFQQMQRLAHGDTDLDTYLAFVRRKIMDGGALCLYASDAEIFDFRPGRFRTEERLSEKREWARIEAALAALPAEGVALAAPSCVLSLLEMPGAGKSLTLERPACPVPVKKQRKYNLARWAVTGRDNTAINAACQRIYEGMLRDEAKADWKELCYLWASDFRTHITETRWATFCARLKGAEARWSARAPDLPAALTGSPVSERHIAITTPALTARLDRRRGLALSSLHFRSHARPVLGSLPHGFFDDIALTADWYTGDSVFEAPGEHKLTDLEWCEARLQTKADGGVTAEALIETPTGAIRKVMHFAAEAPRVDFDLTFDWPEWSKGVLRLGHFTLLPDAFDQPDLTFSTCNGGGRERFTLGAAHIEHGAPVSFLVSSSYGFGMSEGWAEIGDRHTGVRVTVDRATAPLLGMLTHRPLTGRDGRKSLFCQIQLSALELDDTRKPSAYVLGPRRFRFSVEAI
ncbi:MAG: glycoside hydrolase family 57 [Alphaproteobacteria bacterium]|nr:glycoside hydrolase family 57 [Alphaproteobacteria bacterium]